MAKASIESKHISQARLEVGKHLMMLGNLAAGALLFGQAFSGFPFNLRVAILGAIVVVLAYVGAWFFMKGGGNW
jgi:hypothetical protein